ncbi:MAG: metalloregulator ArsR/SmtB family transcription factor [Magnetococcales bacterium]|nr:metalloregulator ArsR/SmtB family transcription factor [Magnetococcales bacterium]
MMTPDALLKTLVDETRLRCLLLLLEERELCVCELGHALEEIQPKISRHLALLRKEQVVQDRRAGQWVYYRLHPELPDWAMTVLQALARGGRETAFFRQDHQRLLHMKDRPDRCAPGACGEK